MIRLSPAILAIALTLSHPAAAQQPSAGCASPVVPTGELAPWTQTIGMTAAKDSAGLQDAKLSAGQAVRIALLPVSAMTYLLPLERPASAASHGGMAQLSIGQPGTYRVALGTGAWIDMTAHGKTIASTAHGHGPGCTGIRKIVDFALEPGDYVVQLSGSTEPETTLLVVQKP